MSRSIFYDFVASGVMVDHPYEPVRCQRVKADIVVFRHCDYGSVYDSSLLIVKYLYGEISRTVLMKEYGIYVLPIFHDFGLRSSTFSICKEYFDYFECFSEYKRYYDMFQRIDFS